MPLWNLDDDDWLDDDEGGRDGNAELQQARDSDMEARGDGLNLVAGWEVVDWWMCVGMGVLVVGACVAAWFWYWSVCVDGHGEERRGYQ